ncbi:PhoH family protein [Halobacillus campisalis]|uniref:PhoH-like protein n=1 Tax=Halobacillus campisalis TaxID=435909 RepID=A0ABW2K483_9BACI|nr:PhoH family protein [Halobacillus campisalis]
MQGELKTIDIQLNNPTEALSLFGTEDRHLKRIEEQLKVTIISRGEHVNVSGQAEHVQLVEDVLLSVLEIIRKGLSITERDVVYAVELAKNGKINQFEALFEDEITRNAKGKSVRVKTLGQRKYVSAIKNHDLVFGIGPAGTGKTYLAVIMAVNALKNGEVKKIILTRPAVEAGESLGFLPGDLKEKVDPYLRPLYDSLHDVFGAEHTTRLIDRGTIEIAPLAYMRGRTLDDAFAILDEAQNTTPEQMKMFLTRLGFGSKMIITGDITQVDLPRGMTSGLKVAEQKLNHVKGSAFIHLDQTDVVRHPLVQRVIDAYEQNP